MVAVGLALSACGAEGANPTSEEAATAGTEWEQLDEIVYVLPETLPEGWTVRVATERPGRPQREWTERSEVLGDGSGERFLVLASTRSDGEPTSGDPGPVQDLPVEAFTYLFAYVLGEDPSPLTARGVVWGDAGLEMRVALLGSAPDDGLIERVAAELARDPRFEFEIPGAAIEAGFAPLGSSPGSTDDVADYTVSWVPRELAGDDRAEAMEQADDGPTIFINVGARFYGQGNDSDAVDPMTAEITHDGELLHLAVLMSGSPISVSGRAVSEDELRALAASLVPLDREVWRAQLGDRLLVDDAAA